MQMYFPSEPAAASFKSTWEAYETILHRDCTVPQNPVDPHLGSGIDTEHDALLSNYNLFNVCHMEGSQSSQVMPCGPCLHHKQETLACL